MFKRSSQIARLYRQVALKTQAYHMNMVQLQQIGSIFDVASDKTSSNDNDIFKSLTSSLDEATTKTSNKRQQFRKQKKEDSSSVLMRSIFEELKSSEANTQTQKPATTSDAKFSFDAFLFGDGKSADMATLAEATNAPGTNVPETGFSEDFYLGQKVIHEDPITLENFIRGKVELISQTMAKVSQERVEALSKETTKLVQLLRSEKTNIQEVESTFLQMEKPSASDFHLLAKAYSKDVSERVGVKYDKALDMNAFGNVLLQTYAKLGLGDKMNQVLEKMEPGCLTYMFLMKNVKEMRASFNYLKSFYDQLPQDLKEEGGFISRLLAKEQFVKDMEQVLLKEGAPLQTTYWNVLATPIIGYNRSPLKSE